MGTLGVEGLARVQVGNTLSNQKCVPDRELTEEEKRTFALLYGPGGFKPDHLTVNGEGMEGSKGTVGIHWAQFSCLWLGGFSVFIQFVHLPK